MPTTLHTFALLHAKALVTAGHILDKGAAFAAAEGITEQEMLSWRLIEDMQPLGFQVAVVVNFARQWPARVAQAPVAEDVSAELSVAQFKAVIADGIAELAALTPQMFEGRDTAPLTWRIGPGMEPTLPAGQWLSGFATTNLYFHLSTAYGILRSRGVALGKPDLFAGGL